MDNTKNFAKVTVSTGYDAAATSVVLTSGHGAKLPVAPFNLTWWNSTDYADPSDDPAVEIVRCTNISVNTITIIRGQESTTATVKNSSGKVYKMIAGITAKVVNTDIPALFSTDKVEEFTTTAGQQTITPSSSIHAVKMLFINRQPLSQTEFSIINSNTQIQVDASYNLPQGLPIFLLYN